MFCKSRAVHFALKKQLEETLQQQVEKRELQPVEQSEEAAPVVLVKKDGGIRVCADFFPNYKGNWKSALSTITN